MKRQENRNKLSAVLLCAALLAGLPLLVACGGEKEEAEVPTVQIRITDNRIEMPNPMPTGAVQFEVVNAGTHEHSLGITGPVGEISLEEPLKPGETATLDEMFLDTGTYRVYCPVDEKHGESMQIALNVRPDAPATKNS